MSAFAAGAAVAAATAIYATCKFLVGTHTSRQDKTSKSGIPGLINLGNTCYVNTVLQALASCSHLRHWLKRQSSTHIYHVTNVVSLLLTDLNFEGPLQCDPCSCEAVISMLVRHGWVIPYEDQDAHELFSVLCSTMNEEMLFNQRNSSILNALQVSSQKQEWIHHKVAACGSYQMSMGGFPFDGYLANQLTCLICGTPYPVKLDTFSCLSVALPPVSSRNRLVTVEELLHQYTNQELVHQVSCPTCSPMKTTFIKRISIAKAPSSLCIHIQRSAWYDETGMPYKRFDRVYFSEFLDVSPFLYLKHVKDKVHGNKMWEKNNLANIPTEKSLGEKLSGRKILRLQACVVHIGDSNSGHFSTYRRSNNQWYYTSDTLVRQVPLSEVLSSIAYMLFFESIELSKDMFSIDMR